LKKLHDILSGVHIVSISGDTNISVLSITADSRKVEAGCVFVAVKGSHADGHDFIVAAIEKKAAAIICEKNSIEAKKNTTFVYVKDSASTLGIAAHNFYNQPSLHLKLIGITGTNGKTTTATLSYHVFEQLGFRTGLISTVENKIHNVTVPATHTTPDPVQLNKLLAEMVAAGCDYAFMEVSSHAAHQKRIAGLHFTGAVFTNISHDHLDYHKTFDEYIAAKKSFFDALPKESFALVNADDKRANVMLQNCNAVKHTYAVKGNADFVCRIKENNITGLILHLDGEEFHTSLVGAFNAWNILAVYAIAMMLGMDKKQTLLAISKVKPVEGRFDVVYSQQDKLTGVIDYAHTPDAVEKILTTLRSSVTADQKIITVIGCGGDRDKTKRPAMAKIAATLSHKAIFTSDNPRSEEPETIVDDMLKGIDQELVKKVLAITDRREAIKTAVMLAHKNDVILVAGKGHEKYQEIKGIKHPFDDKLVLTEIFKSLAR
jgi:UDP-N-acetylmuramoyl-L-alanyl-D-glutamate--2,6-diaminopimelate ligase